MTGGARGDEAVELGRSEGERGVLCALLLVLMVDGGALAVGVGQCCLVGLHYSLQGDQLVLHGVQEGAGLVAQLLGVLAAEDDLLHRVVFKLLDGMNQRIPTIPAEGIRRRQDAVELLLLPRLLLAVCELIFLVSHVIEQFLLLKFRSLECVGDFGEKNVHCSDCRKINACFCAGVFVQILEAN